MPRRKELPDRANQVIPGRLTLKQLAPLVGVHYMTIFNWEKKGWIPKPNWVHPRTKERMYTRDEALRVIAFHDSGVYPSANTEVA